MGKWTCKIEWEYAGIGGTDPEYDEFAQEMGSCCPKEHSEISGVTHCEQCYLYNPDGWPDKKEVHSNAECGSR